MTPSRRSGDTDVTVSGALTFTAGNWDTAQTVTVSAAEDADANDDRASIGHAVAGGDYGSETAGTVSRHGERRRDGLGHGDPERGAGGVGRERRRHRDHRDRDPERRPARRADDGDGQRRLGHGDVRDGLRGGGRHHRHDPGERRVAHRRLRPRPDPGHDGRSGRDGKRDRHHDGDGAERDGHDGRDRRRRRGADGDPGAVERLDRRGRRGVHRHRVAETMPSSVADDQGDGLGGRRTRRPRLRTSPSAPTRC